MTEAPDPPAGNTPRPGARVRPRSVTGPRTPPSAGRTGRGWRGLLRFAVETARELDRDNITLFAAGLAFFALLSGTPLLVAIVSAYGLAADPADVAWQATWIGELLPRDARLLVAEQLREVVRASRTGLGWGTAVSIVTSLYAGSKGVFYLFRALNAASGAEESRRYLWVKALAFAFTLAFIALTVVALGLLTVVPALLRATPHGPALEQLLIVGRWPVLAGGALVLLALVYNLGPAVRPGRWRWVSPGSLLVTPAWLAFSLAYAWFSDLSGKLAETYGSLAAVVGLIMWLFVSAFLVLLGAVLNAKLAGHPRGA